jgi:hypothetical protein
MGIPSEELTYPGHSTFHRLRSFCGPLQAAARVWVQSWALRKKRRAGARWLDGQPSFLPHPFQAELRFLPRSSKKAWGGRSC